MNTLAQQIYRLRYGSFVVLSLALLGVWVLPVLGLIEVGGTLLIGVLILLFILSNVLQLIVTRKAWKFTLLSILFSMLLVPFIDMSFQQVSIQTNPEGWLVATLIEDSIQLGLFGVGYLWALRKGRMVVRA